MRDGLESVDGTIRNGISVMCEGIRVAVGMLEGIEGFKRAFTVRTRRPSSRPPRTHIPSRFGEVVDTYSIVISLLYLVYIHETFDHGHMFPISFHTYTLASAQFVSTSSKNPHLNHV
jgi:hypothetical protein